MQSGMAAVSEHKAGENEKWAEKHKINKNVKK